MLLDIAILELFPELNKVRAFSDLFLLLLIHHCSCYIVENEFWLEKKTWDKMVTTGFGCVFFFSSRCRKRL